MATLLTDSKIRAIKPKANAFYTWQPAATRGTGRVGVKTYPSGRKVFVYRHYVEGKEKFISIGDYPEISLSAATERARELAADPHKGKKPKENHATIKALIDDYIANQKATGKRSHEKTENRLNQALASPHLDPNTPAREVTTATIRRILADFIKRGAVAGSDKLRANLHAVFNFALAADNDPAKMDAPARYNLTSNPVSIIPKQTGGGRALDRYLSWDELYRFIDSINVSDTACPMNPNHARALLLCIYTGGQRPWELITLNKSDVNKKEKTLTISPEISKTTNFHVVPLTKEAMKIIDIQLSLYPDEPHLFPAQTESGHILSAELSKQLRKYCIKEEMEPFTPRDLRRTFKTLAGDMGINIEIRDILQNHKRPGVSGKHYDRYYYLKEKRAAVEQWANRIKSRR